MIETEVLTRFSKKIRNIELLHRPPYPSLPITKYMI